MSCEFTEEELRQIHLALGYVLGLGAHTAALQVKVGEYVKQISNKEQHV